MQEHDLDQEVRILRGHNLPKLLSQCSRNHITEAKNEPSEVLKAANLWGRDGGQLWRKAEGERSLIKVVGLPSLVLWRELPADSLPIAQE